MNRKLQSCFFADNHSYKSLARPVRAFKLHISSVSQQKTISTILIGSSNALPDYSIVTTNSDEPCLS